MEAIVQVGGQQFRVAKGQKIKVHKIAAEVDKKIELTVLAQIDGDKITTGQPILQDAKVTAKVLKQFKDKKVVAATYKRRKGFHKKKGHRQELTEIEIQEIK